MSIIVRDKHSGNEEWIESFSVKANKKYYYNPTTHESRWENPAIVSVADVGDRSDVGDISNATPIAFNNDRPLLLCSSNNSAKRLRRDDSYEPPVSGSAADAAVLKSVNLPEPIIIKELPFSEVNMWERKDIQVNQYLASIYLEGSIIDSSGDRKSVV